MAQRTAFLNSDVKGFNKDFHHTWINNYMLKQPGVMFSNYSTKPEFALGNGQISGGKAIIRCTRTTGTFAGEEILACFESTATENISTSGNKKIYIEIPEVYVNDSTAITDALTQGANLNVGRIVSSDSYPTHSNYIKLWEVTGGDWQNATDLRPEVLRRGKPNTISYFGGNGEEERIDIDNSSLNKYLMSNGAGVAPSWEEGGGGGGGSSENFKRVFTADEDLLAKSMFGVAKIAKANEANKFTVNIGKESGVEHYAFGVILNGNDFDSISLNLSAVSSPADNVTVRVETVDSYGNPTGTLIDVGAHGTATPTATQGVVTVNMASTITGLTAHTRAAVVLDREGSVSSSNYFVLGTTSVMESSDITEVKHYEGDWVVTTGNGCGCVTCDGFADEVVVSAGNSDSHPQWLGYCETGATAGNDFTGILQGTIDYTGAKTGDKYYVRYDGTLITTETNSFVGTCVADGVLQLGSRGDEDSGTGVELKIKARTSLQKGDVVRMSFENNPSGGYTPTVRKVASRMISLTGAYDGGQTIEQESSSYVGLKTINVGYNKQLSVFYSNNKLAMCLSDDQLGNYNYYYTDYKAYDFDVTSPKRGYAVVIFSDRSSGGNQYPKAFAVNCTVNNNYGLTVGTAVTLESISATGNKKVGICNVDDNSSDTVAAIWNRYYTEGSQTEDGTTMYSIIDIDESTLALTCTAPTLFNGDINDLSQVPFGYLGNGRVGTVVEREYKEGSTITKEDYKIVMRRYSGGTGAGGGTFGSMKYSTLLQWESSGGTRYPGISSASGEPQQIFGVNGMVFVRLGGSCYICGRYPENDVRYRYNDLWSGAGAKRYYPVDGGVHLLCVDMTRDEDNQRGYITITKFEVGNSSLHEIARWKYTTGASLINGSSPMPQITEIGNRNLWLRNDKDGDYYLTYISNAGQLIMGNTNSHGGEAIGVVKESVAAGEMATIVVSGLAPGEVTEPGEKIHLQPDGTLSGYWTDYPMGIGVEVGNPGKVLLKALPYSHNYLS